MTGLSREDAPPRRWWIRLCRLLWLQRGVMWSAIILGLVITVFGAWLFTPWGTDFTKLPVGWVVKNPLIILLIGICLLLLTGLVGAVYRMDEVDLRRQSLIREIDLRRQSLIREIFANSNRRAVFTRVHREINYGTMFESLEEYRTYLQQKALLIEPENLQQLVQDIIADLDAIARCRDKIIPPGLARRDYKAYDDAVVQIDEAKRRIIKKLIELSEAVHVPYTLPRSLTYEVFFDKEEADSPPRKI